MRQPDFTFDKSSDQLGILAEQVISFSDAARELPRRRGGRKVNISTLYRWASVGGSALVFRRSVSGISSQTRFSVSGP